MFRHPRALASAGVLTLAVAGAVFVGSHGASAASAVTVNGGSTFQHIDGFGFSEAFGRSDIMHGSNGLSAANQKRVLDLLFSPTTGAGFSILRNIIASDAANTIEPTSPGSPNGTPAYRFNGSDTSQVWLSQQAMGYGVRTIYADAWSAPGFMKNNGNEANGGTLCGLAGASCASGDWRQAYANYLAKYVDFYRQAGVPISHLGFLNEPEFVATYSSMIVSGTQAADFIKILDSTLRARGLSVSLVCCDAEGWAHGNDMLNDIARDPTAFGALDVASAHGYTAAPTGPFTQTAKPVWETEWADFNPWDPAWDDGSAAAGFTWASRIMTALTTANASAFLHWWGASASTANSGLIQLNGDTVNISARLWAFANYSRFIRPGATRIGASTADGNLKIAAFRNADGSLAIVALNNASTAIQTSYTLQNAGVTAGAATPFLTNGGSGTAAQAAIPISGGTFTATVPARSLVTYSIPAGGGTQPTSPPVTTTPPPIGDPTPTTPPAGTGCRVTDTMNAWNTGFTANLTVTNTGTAPVNGWSLVFTLPSGQTITSGWNATYAATSGQVTARNMSFNAAIPPGGSVDFGFQASHTGNTSPPGSFTLNGAACTVG
jgi:glucuronoarabinoxylan endo-1,4-beta-xylanase